MKKYSFLLFHQDYKEFLDDIRQLGMIHIIEKQKEVPPKIQDKYEHINDVKSVLKFLMKREVERNPSKCELTGAEAFDVSLKAMNELEEKHQLISTLKKEMGHLSPWGDCPLENYERLEKSGIPIHFYTITSRKFVPEWVYEYPIEVINEHAGQTYFILIGQKALPEDFPAEPVHRPQKSLSQLTAQLEEVEKEVQNLKELLDRHASESLDNIDLYCRKMIESVEYDNTIMHTSHEVEDKVMLLEGWIPERQSKEMDAYLEGKSIVYLSHRATQEDKAPVALRNNKFTQKFESLVELYSLPKYGELDLTPFFAPFYALFFGFCLGDIGYGILIAIVSLVAKNKVPKELKQTMGLVFYLGLSTILFGIIGGTFFGIPLYETNIPFYVTASQLLDSQGTDINNFLFGLSLLLGGIQIIFGLILKAINESRQFGWKVAVGTIGWITLLLGGIAIYGIKESTGMELAELNPAIYGLLIVSGTMILLLNNMTRNVFKNFGIGLWDSYNMLTGLLGDLLSYIRLFALGISSAILGFVFNSLAVSMSGDIPVLSAIIMVLILVVGHGINLFMSGIGAFVHPLRLTFVEFYKNAGFSGGGKKYNPFRKLT